ncbi:presenilin-associated rhomboid-like protein A, mitochondrial isoform X1 [Salmo salar]|uniref:rhomboid protease n=1 Tax=Salmo salar TaxID=8030 RepID=A0A1S3QZA3_SALSA|nr:presenilins-associated rhomboid-like protein, mitochondrial isoform X1 [Salmo salar]|eukprot:XP_014044784.1 PREDICTED: presenilins-associated rhomboid-like protein, mitochondrial isoform X1 [Salmo salar]
MAWRGYFVKWTKTECINSVSTVSRGSRFTLHPQQRCGFRKEARKPETWKRDRGIPEETGPPPSEAADAVVSRKAVPPKTGPPPPGAAPRRTGKLFKPFMFTIGFTGCSFGAAAILQYESLKSRVKTARDEAEQEKSEKASQDMTYWHNWWNQLTDFQKQVILLMSFVDDFWSSLTEGQQMATGIIAVNAVVLCCWRIPSMQRSMVKYFTANPASKTRCLPMLLSTFSHYSIIHMAANMYVLWTFSSSIVSLLGKEQFLAVYLSAGTSLHSVISTMVSYVCKTSTGRLHPSLGASGAIMTVLAAVCTKMPEAKLGIILLPMVSFTAGNALKAIVAMDAAGLIMGWRLFDHAAHLGGALFGVWYVAYGHKLMWRKREPLVKAWHSMRSQAPGGRGRPGGSGSDGGRPGPV